MQHAEQLALAALEALQAGGIALDRGLTEEELRFAEDAIGVGFPADLRLLLAHALPVGDGFPNWREPHGQPMVDQMAHPIEGVLFDVRVNHFWMPLWPTRPSGVELSVALASELLATWPKLIPLYGHRYLPSEPNRPGNPVLSVMQTNIIYYGSTLPDYFQNEFVSRRWAVGGESRSIPSWGYFVEDPW